MIKQVIVIRRDLKMRRGKEIAQGAHAAMAFLTKRIDWLGVLSDLTEVELEWIRNSFTKIVLQVSSQEELEAIAKSAQESGVECNIITDSGKTEFGWRPTVTALALGPDTDEKLDPITQNLKLY